MKIFRGCTKFSEVVLCKKSGRETTPRSNTQKIERANDSESGIYAMAECHIDDKMADNIYALSFM